MSRGRGGHAKEYHRFSPPSHHSKSANQELFPQTFPAHPGTPYVPSPNASLGRFQHPPPYLSPGPPGASPSGPFQPPNPFTSQYPGPSQVQAQRSSSNRGVCGDEAADFRQQQILFLRGQCAEAPKFVPHPSEHFDSPPQHQAGYYNSPKPGSYVRRGGYIRGKSSWEKVFKTRYHAGPKSGWEQQHLRSQNIRYQCDSQVDCDAAGLSSAFHALSLENFGSASSSGGSGIKASRSLPSGKCSLHLTPEIQKQVLSSLASLQPSETIQAKDLAKRFRLPKKIVNQALYSLFRLNQAVIIEGTPPLWRLRKEGDAEASHGRTQFRAKTDQRFAQDTFVEQDQCLIKEVNPDSNLTSASSSTATEASSDYSEESEDSEKESSSEVLDSDKAVDTFSSTEKESDLSKTMEAKDSKEQILKYLHETGQANALMIAKNLGLKNAAAKHVNPTLYAMEKHGDLSRRSGSMPPIWELSAHQREKMDRQRKAAVAASITRNKLEHCGTQGPVIAAQAAPKIVCGSGLSEEAMTWENLPTSQTRHGKDGTFGNGMLEKQSDSDMDSVPAHDKIPSVDNDLTSVPYSSHDASYYQADNKNGGHSEWASDDIPEFLNTIRSEVAVSLAAPLPPAQNTETTKLQKLKLALSKNPVSGLMEYAQYLGYNCEFLLLEQSGPSHNPRLVSRRLFCCCHLFH